MILPFVGFAALILYIVAGYPLLLWVLARRRPSPKPSALAPPYPTISVLMPVRNGAAFLATKLDNLLSLPYPGAPLEILVVNDGSTDDTQAIARAYADRGVILLNQPPSGKATGLNFALEHASGELLLYTDVRQELSRSCLLDMVPFFADPTIGLVTGELVIRGAGSIEELSVGLYWEYEKRIRLLLSQIGSFVLASGCLYLMRRSLAKPLPVDTLADDAVLAVYSLLAGKRNVFFPSAKAFDFPTQIQNEFPRKVRSLAGVYQMWLRFPSLSNPFSPVGFHFLSYKASRLLLPYLLILLFLSAWLLPFPANFIFGSLQGFVFLLALLDYIQFPLGPLARLASPLRAFLSLMLAAVFAIRIFFVPAQDLWRTTIVGRPPR